MNRFRTIGPKGVSIFDRKMSIHSTGAMIKMKYKGMVWLAALGFAAMLPSAVYGQLVQNGGFESTTSGNGQLGYNTSATDWTVSGGYTFVYSPGTADTSGANGQYGNVSLWGPGNGAPNGLTTSPDGGNFIAQDGDFQQAPISQTITGLTAGGSYIVSFYWAAAQQEGFGGSTSDQWQVSLGSQTDNTASVGIGSEGFSGWIKQDLKFTATSNTETLSFLANGPGGAPPFALLDGVKMQSVPGPESAASMVLGVLGFGMFARRRARSAKSRA
jgi:hypothetical protein